MDITRYCVTHKLIVIIVLMLLIIIYAGIMNHAFPSNDPFDISKSPVLRSDTLIKKTQSEISSHNAVMRGILVQYLTMENANARESTRMQTRGFYLAIIAGLLAFLIGRNPLRSVTRTDADDAAADRAGKRKVAYIVLALIVVVYGLEVYQDDLTKRYNTIIHIYASAVDQLCDSAAVYDTWQVIDYGKRVEQMNHASELLAKWPRVVFSATRPAADQIVLYFLPFVALAVEALGNKRNLSHSKTRSTPQQVGPR